MLFEVGPFLLKAYCGHKQGKNKKKDLAFRFLTLFVRFLPFLLETYAVSSFSCVSFLSPPLHMLLLCKWLPFTVIFFFIFYGFMVY